MDSRPRTSHATVFAGGEANVTPSPGPRNFVVAADSGYDHAHAWGLDVDVLIGDLDSISDQGLAHAEETGVEIVRHDAAKDATDVELALDLALDRGAQGIELYGGEGGELGHLLGVASLIGSDRYSSVFVEWYTQSGIVTVVRPERPLTVAPPIGTGVSLIPVIDTDGVNTTGLLWPLRGEPLQRGTSRGLSNQTNEDEVGVTIASGLLLALVEGPRTT